MRYSLATGANELAVKRLLAANELPHSDITLAHLKHFMLGFDGPTMVAVGGLEIQHRSALLRSLAVDANYRNRGIATRLVGKLEDYAKSRGVEVLYLLTLTAESFFKKCGYRRAARDAAPDDIQKSSEFQSLCPASAVCMVKKLGNG